MFGDAGFAIYNPAAIAGVGAFDGSGTSSLLIVDSAYENASGALFNGDATGGAASGEGAISDAYIPSFAGAVRVSDRLVLGAALNAPFGLKSEYEADALPRYHAQESELRAVAATFLASVELTPELALGAGLRVQYADLSITGAIDAAGIATAFSLGAFAPGTADAFVDVAVDDVSLGFVAGANWRPVPALSIGASYTSKIEHDFSGEAAFDLALSPAAAALAGVGLLADTGAATAFPTPALVEFGAVWSVSERVDLMASASLARWSAFEGLAVTFDNPLQPPEVLTQDWRDAWAVSAGGEIKLDAQTKLRAGVMFDDSPVRDARASPRIPDDDRWWIAAGGSRALTERWSADVGFAAVFFSARRYELSGAEPETLFRGSFEADADAKAFIVSARLRYSF